MSDSKSKSFRTRTLHRVVITGMGAISPIGNTRDEIESSLRQARSGIRTIERFDTSTLPVRFGGEAVFNPHDYMDPKEARRNDRFIQMCLAATDQAVNDSRLTPERLKQAGVIMGIGLGGLQSIEENAVELEKSGPRKVSPFFVPSILANLASGQVSIRYGCKGPNFAISSACASGSQAIGQAYREIQAGRREIWIAGGAEAPITPLGISGFAAARALSRQNDKPAQASRPFDQARDGFVIGEGAATFILESIESAELRGAKIYGEVIGYGVASDGYHVTEPEPTGDGACTAMSEAIQEAGIQVSEIDYVNAHATSTLLGDQVEARALATILGSASSKTYVSSTKSLTGHACGAAGALESIFCLLMMERKFLAPALNLQNPSPEFVFKSPVTSDLSIAPQVVMNNSFGFGGINTSLLFRSLSKN